MVIFIKHSNLIKIASSDVIDYHRTGIVYGYGAVIPLSVFDTSCVNFTGILGSLETFVTTLASKMMEFVSVNLSSNLIESLDAVRPNHSTKFHANSMLR